MSELVSITPGNSLTHTVLQLALGISIGALLILKLVIMRYFKHMEARLVQNVSTEEISAIASFLSVQQ